MSTNILRSLTAAKAWVAVDATWLTVGLQPRNVSLVAAHALCSLAGPGAIPPLRDLPGSLSLYTDPEAPCPMVHGGIDQSRSAARVRLSVSGSYWCQLTYQFIHEFGHVAAGSWGPNWQEGSAHKWLEEACCGALSLLALDRMAVRWKAANIFGDAAYSLLFRTYLTDELAKYRRPSALHFIELAPWWLANSAALHEVAALEQINKPLAALLYEEFKAEPLMWLDMHALNRWPRPRGLGLAEHLTAWEQACQKVGTTGSLPRWCRVGLLGHS